VSLLKLKALCVAVSTLLTCARAGLADDRAYSFQQSILVAGGSRSGGSKMSSGDLVDKAEKFVDQLKSGQITAAYSEFDAKMRLAVSPAKLQAIWSAIIAQQGAFKERLTPRLESIVSYETVFVPVVFARSTLDLKIVFSGTGHISGFFIVPHSGGYKPARYDKPASYKEENVKIGTGEWQLDGVITVPVGEGPFPGIVLVHGSGPQDKDESVGPNKPFRDLAHGLALLGVAVLRYEKRTKQYQEKMAGAGLSKLTLKEETIDDAVEAAKVLRNSKSIRRDKVFILGHSLGGTAIPRIAEACPAAYGFICLAGSSEPLEDAMVRQLEYIVSLGGPQAAATRKSLPELRQQAAAVRDLKPGDSSAKETSLLGVPASYWLDMKAHDPLIEIKELKHPVLFLQGGRDYQVTADGDFRRWQYAVRDVPDSGKLFTFKLYPDLNHLFVTGSGMATPTEMMGKPGNVDRRVITDIATWVKTQ
jgi:uncharacterized protein